MTLDPRINAVRLDLADERLKGRVTSAHFVEGKPARIVWPVCPLLSASRFDARRGSEALFGERVSVFEEREGWAWVQLAADGYVGYLNAEALGPALETTHRVTVPQSFIYPAADIKTRPEIAIPMQAALSVEKIENGFARLATGGFVFAAHLASRTSFAADPAAVAERFLNAPYLWGGKSWQGLDCSGLIQLALAACGLPAPRDSDMQQALGMPIETSAPLQRNDLIFWKGHVGIMLSGETLLHAHGTAMQVTAEPLAAAQARIAEAGSPIIARRRLPQ